jgi:hypothetical protein
MVSVAPNGTGKAAELAGSIFAGRIRRWYLSTHPNLGNRNSLTHLESLA